MNTKLFIALALGTSLLGANFFSNAAEAAGHRYAAPHNQGSQASASDYRDDHIDLTVLNRTIVEWQVARRTHNAWKEQDADRHLMSLIHQEMAENQREFVAAKQEVAQSRAELRRSGRNAARNQGYYGTGAATQDDLRDLRDDRQDATAKRIEAQAFNRVARELMAMQPAFDNHQATRAMYKTKASLLRQLRSMALSEIDGSYAELREDQAEDAEDYIGYAAPPPPAPYRR